MTAPRKPRATAEEQARAERAQRIADGADMAAGIVRDVADLIREHADEIAGWTLRLRRYWKWDRDQL